MSLVLWRRPCVNLFEIAVFGGSTLFGGNNDPNAIDEAWDASDFRRIRLGTLPLGELDFLDTPFDF